MKSAYMLAKDEFQIYRFIQFLKEFEFWKTHGIEIKTKKSGNFIVVSIIGPEKLNEFTASFLTHACRAFLICTDKDYLKFYRSQKPDEYSYFITPEFVYYIFSMWANQQNLEMLMRQHFIDPHLLFVLNAYQSLVGLKPRKFSERLAQAIQIYVVENGALPNDFVSMFCSLERLKYSIFDPVPSDAPDIPAWTQTNERILIGTVFDYEFGPESVIHKIKSVYNLSHDYFPDSISSKLPKYLPINLNWLDSKRSRHALPDKLKITARCMLNDILLHCCDSFFATDDKIIFCEENIQKPLQIRIKGMCTYWSIFPLIFDVFVDRVFNKQLSLLNMNELIKSNYCKIDEQPFLYRINILMIRAAVQAVQRAFDVTF
jgi:hypothetical protein